MGQRLVKGVVYEHPIPLKDQAPHTLYGVGLYVDVDAICYDCAHEIEPVKGYLLAGQYSPNQPPFLICICPRLLAAVVRQPL